MLLKHKQNSTAIEASVTLRISMALLTLVLAYEPLGLSALVAEKGRGKWE
jgi:hypothetical protein